MNTEVITKKASQEIKVYKTMVSALETIKAKATKFEGKVINKRFFDYINNELKESGNTCKLSWCREFSSILFSLFDSGYCNHTGEYSTLSYYDVEKNLIRSDKGVIVNERLNCENLNSEIEREIESISKEIADKEGIIANGVNYQKMMAEAVEAFNKVYDSVPYEFREGLSRQYYRVYNK